MFRYFKDWTKFEIKFLIIGLILSILSAVIFHGKLVEVLYTSTYFITALLMSKGKVESYGISFVSVFFYAIVSYNQGYYGELIITIFLTLPLAIVGIISWIRNQDIDKGVIIVNTLSKKEIYLVILSQIFLFSVYYSMLKAFQTELLMLSTISLITSVLAAYFEARRSEMAMFCYAANDFTIILLWLVPIINGQISLITVLVGPLLLLVNDFYGVYNWSKIKKEQSANLLQEV